MTETLNIGHFDATAMDEVNIDENDDERVNLGEMLNTIVVLRLTAPT